MITNEKDVVNCYNETLMEKNSQLFNFYEEYVNAMKNYNVNVVKEMRYGSIQVCTGLAAEDAELSADVRLLYSRKAKQDRGRLVAVVRTQVHRQSVERALVLGRLVQLGHLLHQLALLFDGEVAAHNVSMAQAKVRVELLHVDVLQAHTPGTLQSSRTFAR